MKVTYVLKLASAALIVATSVSAWSQASMTGATQMGSGMEASAPSDSPKAMKKADRLLARKVRAALGKNKIKVDEIIIRAKNGTVWLEGSVPSEDQLNDAANVAQQVSGVTAVKNALSLKEEGR